MTVDWLGAGGREARGRRWRSAAGCGARLRIEYASRDKEKGSPPLWVAFLLQKSESRQGAAFLVRKCLFLLHTNVLGPPRPAPLRVAGRAAILLEKSFCFKPGLPFFWLWPCWKALLLQAPLTGCQETPCAESGLESWAGGLAGKWRGAAGGARGLDLCRETEDASAHRMRSLLISSIRCCQLRRLVFV